MTQISAIDTSPTTSAIEQPSLARPSATHAALFCRAGMTHSPFVDRTPQRSWSQATPLPARRPSWLLNQDDNGSDHEARGGITRRHLEFVGAVVGAVRRIHIGRRAGDPDLAVLGRRDDLQAAPPDVTLAGL